MTYSILNTLIDTTSHKITQDGKPIKLTHIEFELLLYLAQHADKLCTREDILDNVWGQRFQYDTGTVDVHLHSLRRKLGFERKHPIESIRNIGVILHTTPKKQSYSLNIQDFTIQWIKAHEADFDAKHLIPHLHLDPFVSEITLSPKDLHQMLDGILNVLLLRWPICWYRCVFNQTYPLHFPSRLDDGFCSKINTLTNRSSFVRWLYVLSLIIREKKQLNNLLLYKKNATFAC